MITKIGRAFEFAGLLKRVAYDMRHGKTFDYKWTVDMKRHGIGVEKLEWAYMQIMHNEEFKNLNRQAKKLKKDATAIDALDGDTKEVLKTVLDENEKLKKQIEQMMKDSDNNNGNKAPRPAVTIEQLKTLGPSMCLAHTGEMTEENKDVPDPTITHINTRRNVDAPTPASYQQDPFQVIDRLKGQLTRGSLIEIKITV
jgi:hypothetical protein